MRHALTSADMCCGVHAAIIVAGDVSVYRAARKKMHLSWQLLTRWPVCSSEARLVESACAGRAPASSASR